VIRAEKSVGSDRPASSALVWSDCVPPSNAIALTVSPDEMLLYGRF
jgi:hypothetical protein